MSRNTMYVLVAIIIVGGAFMGYRYYQDSQKTGVDISIGEGGVSIEKK